MLPSVIFPMVNRILIELEGIESLGVAGIYLGLFSEPEQGCMICINVHIGHKCVDASS